MNNNSQNLRLPEQIHRFYNFRIPELQKYLRDRGVTVTGYNKEVLREIAIAVDKLRLPVDPDFSRESVEVCIEKKLLKAGLTGVNPFELDGYTKDFSCIPEFGLIDIFNYLIFAKADLDGKKLKSYKSFEDYRLYYDGHVEFLMYNPVSDTSKTCLFKAKVKPTQRDKTYLQKEFYDLWFAVEKEDGFVITGYCECKGGPRQQDVAIPIRNLQLVKPQYGMAPPNTSKPHSDMFEPRSTEHRSNTTWEQKIKFGLKLQQISDNAQALDLLLDPDTIRPSLQQNSAPDIVNLSIFEKKFPKLTKIFHLLLNGADRKNQWHVQCTIDASSEIIETSEL
ncbi:hypothetical protein LOTGIDRAFT_171630 [Lottia gigantea]|uniref:Uncharacterized protein n=1 Tax=Lottia gigantea TaxID=225164 RepID=V4AGV0_LOTGI|nr:hypothetical protein LOTGIDRAFT_171630 [Lottia gigantea]ESP03284.1 hypothetical protein LOTGIDRAFT_171630 [Lottia gigantea]